jgi:chemotaxis protein MotB
MTIEPANSNPEEEGGGAPMWMVTYGDSITLLLTFFVMLLTFSTPNKESMDNLSRGIMQGSRQVALFSGPADRTDFVTMPRRLAESRLDDRGAESPPMAKEDPISELKQQFESMDISQLKVLQGGRVIRIPTVELFGTGSELTDDGRQVLENVVKVLRARRYSVVVRVEARTGPEQSLRLGMLVTEYLSRGAGGACPDIGLSDNVNLLGSPAGAGTCEIVMLEV